MTGHTTGPRAISDERTIEKTGRPASEWYALLDAWDGPAKGHTAMARFLTDEHGVSGWWAQTITNRYEWERGLRVEAAVPDDLSVALDAHTGARERFEALAMKHRHEYIRWISEAKRPETRARRVAETIERVLTAMPSPKG